MSSLQQIIRHTVQLHGNRVATRFAGRTRTWSELQNRIARLASGLHALGIEEGDRVAVLALNSDRYYEFYFGAAWAGAVFVPVNTRLAPAEFLHWLNDSGSKALFIDDSFLEAVSGIRDQLETVSQFIYMGKEICRRAASLSRTWWLATSRHSPQVGVMTTWSACSTPAGQRENRRA